jgi:hypothetical protein
LPASPQANTAVGSFDLGDSDIDLWREPSIQSHLLFAEKFARFQGREVEKAKVDWLFALVQETLREEEPGDGPLPYRDPSRSVGIDVWTP